MFSKRKQSNNYSSFRQKKYSRSIKKYENPFFESKKRRAKKEISEFSLPTKAKIISLIVLGFFIFLFWFIFYSDYFTVKTIEARGEGRIESGAIKSLAWKQIKDSDFILWQQKNIFIFNKKELIKTLNLKYAFNDILIAKKLPNKIIIDYNEKENSFTWLEKGIYYYTDLHGYIINRIGDSPEGKNYPLIENKSSNFITNNRVGINYKLLDYVSLILEKISIYQDLPVDKFILEDDNATVKVKIKNGPKIFFNINGDIDKQLNKALALKNKILKDDFYKKEYIDVRIGDKVYYR